MINSEIPIHHLSSVVLDLETTGLEVRTDRIVQIGAVYMYGDEVQVDQTYDQLIYPTIPINDQVTQIHHIDDEMVRHQPTYKEKYKEIDDFIKNRVIVGFNIGFDLAIIRNETKRLGFPVLDYRCLEVRLLGELLDFPPRCGDLKGMADFLNLSCHQLHNALSDALLTAQIFAQMIPRLRKMGIKKLSDLEKKCYERQRLNPNYASDWYLARPPGMSPEPLNQHQWNMMERIDPFPFSHKVREIMKQDLLIVRRDCAVNEAIQQMAQKSYGSVLISDLEPEGRIVGILTERDILKAVAIDLDNTLDQKVEDLMSTSLKTISQDAFLYQAIETLQVNRIRHLPVYDHQGQIIGMVSNRDLNRKRITNFYRNQTRIEKARNAEELHDVFAGIPLLVRRLLREEVSALKIAQVISNECIGLTYKATVLAEKIMLENTGEPPPMKYAVMVLGSSGREESLLAFDQDNAIIYQDPEGDKESYVKDWFLQLGGYLNQILHDSGIPYCKGHIMAGDRNWCFSLSDWKQKVTTWFGSSSPKSALGVDVFLDHQFVYGQIDLVQALRKFTYCLGRESTSFLKSMGEYLIENNHPPLSLLGNIKTERGWIDMKMKLLFPIVGLARLFALKVGFDQSNHTAKRLEKAQKCLRINAYEIEILQEIQHQAFSFILTQQLKNLDSADSPSARVFLPNFSRSKVERLKWLIPSLKGIETMVHEALQVTDFS